MMSNKYAERRALVERLKKHRAEIAQLFADIAHWNESVRPPGVAPIDPDPDGMLARLAAAYDRTIAAEEARGQKRKAVGLKLAD